MTAVAQEFEPTFEHSGPVDAAGAKPRPAPLRAAPEAAEGNARSAKRTILIPLLMLLAVLLLTALVLIIWQRSRSATVPVPTPKPAKIADPTAWLDPRAPAPPSARPGASIADPHMAAAKSTEALASANGTDAHVTTTPATNAAPATTAVPATAIDAVLAEILRGYAELKVLLQRVTTMESSVSTLATDVKSIDERERQLAERLARLEARTKVIAVGQAPHRTPHKVAKVTALAVPPERPTTAASGPKTAGDTTSPSTVKLISIDMWGGTPSVVIQDGHDVRFLAEGEQLPSGLKLERADVAAQKAVFEGPRGEHFVASIAAQGSPQQQSSTAPPQ